MTPLPCLQALPVTLAVRSGRDRHPVTVTETPDGGLRVECTCQPDAATERILVALGGDGPPCLRLERDARHLAERRRRLPLLDAARWVAAVGADPALTWLSWGFEPDEAAAWVDEGVERPEEVAGWHDLGADGPTATGAWKDAGVATAREAAAWARVGVRATRDLGEWRRAGVFDPLAARDWVNAGVGVAPQVRRWLIAGYRDVATVAAWARAGALDPDDVTGWRAAGVTDPEEVLGWYRVGVAHPDQTGPWRRLGFASGRDAARWAWPRLVTGPDEVTAWRAAGVTDPAAARRLVIDWAEPAGVGRLRAGAFRRLRDDADGLDRAAGPVVVADPASNRSTEISFYAYGHLGVPEEATHWRTVEFDGERELRGARREGLVAQPRLVAAGGIVEVARARYGPDATARRRLPPPTR